MHAFTKIITLGFLLVLATSCVAPPLSPEDAASYALYAEARATEAAANDAIASAKATEAAAGQQIAQLTAEAAAASATITTTATLTPTAFVTSTIPITDSLVISPTVQASTFVTDLLASSTVTATVQVTATVEVTATPAVSLTVIATTTVTTTVAATATATSVAIPTPSTATTGTGWLWPGLPASGSAGEVSAATATPAPTPTTFGTAIVTSAQANMRGGPGTTFPVVATSRQGNSLQVTGSNADQSWWQVCCIDDQTGWVSQSVIRFQGDRQTVPVIGPLMPDDLNASWALRWECHGSGCKQEECLGQSKADALRVIDGRWLEVTRQATWPDGCGEPEDWLTQVDRYTGKERQSSASATLFNIWEGANPGSGNRTVDLMDSKLSVWCTDSRTREVEQQDGWTVLYEGQACYDTEAGVLALMQYVKRWLYSGTVNGQTFDREYFGDYEVYQQVLTGANAPLTGQPQQ